MKILFAGTPEVAADVLKAIVLAGHEVVLVLTREDAPTGRGKVMTESAVAISAAELDIQTVKTNRPDAEDLAKIKSSGAQLGIVVAYGTILKVEVLDSLAAGWFNLHFSLLPKYRGAAPVQRSIMAGDNETGVTMFKLEQGMDTGPIAGQAHTSINPRETSGELLARLGLLSVSLLSEVLPGIYSGTLDLREQKGKPTFAPKPTREEAKINFNQEAIDIQHQILGLNPGPMAWCLAGEEPMRVLDALETRSSVVLDAIGSSEQGSISSHEGRVFIHCGSGTVLELIEVQPSSKRAMLAKDWYNGNRKIEKLL